MRFRYLLYLLSVILLAGCVSPEHKLLERADSVIIDHPDSAMAILTTIDRNRLSKSDLPYYDLLYTQAQVEASDKRLYSDSLISIAYAKYCNDTHGDKGIRANYYLGRVLANQYFTVDAKTDRTEDCMKHVLAAYEQSKKLNNEYWQAKSGKLMADLLHGTGYYHEAISLAQQAADYFKRMNMQKDCREALIRISRICINQGNPVRTYEILDSLRNQCMKEQPVDSAFLAHIIPMIEQARQITDMFEASGWQSSDKEAPVKKTYRDYYNGISERNARNYWLFRSLLWVAVIVSLIIISILCRMFYFRNKAQKAKMASDLESFLSLKADSDRIADERAETIGHLKQKLEEHERQEDCNNKIVRDLLTDKWRTLDMLCVELFDLGQSDSERKRVVRNIEKELKKMVSPQGIIDIVEAVDRHMDGIITRLRQQCPFLKEADVNFLGLIYAGFSVRAVCMFMGMEYRHFYVKKSRLMKRIQNSDAPDRELFIERIQRK